MSDSKATAAAPQPLDAFRGRLSLLVVASAAIAGIIVGGDALFPHRSATVSLSFTSRIGGPGPPQSANAFESTEILRVLAARVSWHGSLSSLRRRFSVVQGAGGRSARLIAKAPTDTEARRLVGAWAQLFVSRRAILLNSENLLTDAGFEHSFGGWVSYNGNGGDFPSFARVSSQEDVHSGRYALAVTAHNSEAITRSKYAWTNRIFPVRPGERYLVRAYVSGRASVKQPILLGFRVLPAEAVTQEGLQPFGHGIAKTNKRAKWVMEGIYRVAGGVTGIQPAVWQEGVLAGQTTHFAIDDVALVPRNRRNDVAVSSMPVQVGSRSRSLALAAAAGLVGGIFTLLLIALFAPGWRPRYRR